MVSPTEGPGTIPTATPTPTVTPTCADFDLRLGNMIYSVTDDILAGTSRLTVGGRVEVCFGGSFYSICDEGWGQEEAQVTCNALNYPSRNYRKSPQQCCALYGGILCAICHA